ncbi:MAG: EAL domain-containing protein [Acidimicrobiales bacterium]
MIHPRAVADADGPEGPQGSGTRWQQRLVRTMSRESFHTVFQPILDVARGVVTGYEALTRFDERGPAVEDWFAAARRLGVGADLEAAVMRKALAARSQLPPNCFLAVNVSPVELSSPQVRGALEECWDLAGVVIELTEQAAVDSYADLEGDLRRWRAAGALVAVDDAGAGYAGLRHLLEVQPSIVKLDRHLVDRIDRDPAKRVLVEMIGTFADRTDAWVVAEGIERMAEMEVIAELGVPLAQGYFVGRPAPPWTSLGDAADWASERKGEASTPRAGSVGTHVRHCPLVANMDEAAAMLGADADLEWVVIADRHGRPRATAAAGDVAARGAQPALLVHASTAVAQAVQRAMVRPSSQRYTPLVVTDDAGGYLGIAAVDRLVTELAAVAAGATARTGSGERDDRTVQCTGRLPVAMGATPQRGAR